MSLVPGIHLGAYEVLAPLGAGGMGEVYKARDTRLDREVAIKVLPERLAADSHFNERFKREARALSQLTHPHICTLHDIGIHEGTTFLVMELLHGDTLAARLARGPLPLGDALTTAIQIASALDVAHRAGIVHRDLKPGNIFLVRRGGASTAPTAKLLDFGLAKTRALAPELPLRSMGAEADATAAVRARGTATMAPLTEAGMIFGTFQYMAPEQLEGQEADARTDLFAFGCVLYEMLTGRRAFEGSSYASLIAAILHTEPPPVSTLQPIASRSIDRVVKKCLAKNPDDRWQSARDLRDALEWLAEPGTGVDSSAAIPVQATLGSTDWRRAAPWAAIGALAFTLVLASWAPWRESSPLPGPLRVSAALGTDASLAIDAGAMSAAAVLSPNGSVVAFAAQSGTSVTPQLYVRRLDQLQATPLSDTEGAHNPFFSPDGQWLAFFARGQLKKISVTGGAAVTLCDAPNGRGGAWAEDGTIVFTPDNQPYVRLSRVSSAGGTPQPLTSSAEPEWHQRWPQVLPGSKAVLYTGNDRTGLDDAHLVVQPLLGGAPKVVHRGGYHGRYLPTGHLVYVDDGALFAVPFDLDRLEVTGRPALALQGVMSSLATGGAQFAASSNGTLVYLAGPTTSSLMPIHWMDKKGKATPLRATPTNWFNLHFSPDGRRLVMAICQGPPCDVWIHDWARDMNTRLTFDPAAFGEPVWTPDGRRITFSSARADKSAPNLYWQSADRPGEAERLTESKHRQLASSWHPSGKFLAFEERSSQTHDDVMMLPMEGDEASGWKPGRPTVFLNSLAAEREPTFSPDGRWLAYSSNESGQYEVYVRPFPGPGGKWSISTGGGSYPTWSHTKREFFYGTPHGQIMVVPYAVSGHTFGTDTPRLWSEGRYMVRGQNRMFDLHPDGERFALAPAPPVQEGVTRDHLTFIFNFSDELRRIAPATR